MMSIQDSEVIIPTRSGGRVAIYRPEPGSFDIRDIAGGLARRYRWSAQSDLTVAQHSVHVSLRLSGVNARWGLMHDAAEAFLPDVARPFKEKLMVRASLGPHSWTFQRFGAIENRLLKAIGEQFGLPWPIPPAVHEADDRETAREARDLFGDVVVAGEAYPEPLETIPQPLAETRFLRRFTELFREV